MLMPELAAAAKPMGRCMLLAVAALRLAETLPTRSSSKCPHLTRTVRICSRRYLFVVDIPLYSISLYHIMSTSASSRIRSVLLALPALSTQLKSDIHCAFMVSFIVNLVQALLTESLATTCCSMSHVYGHGIYM